MQDASGKSVGVDGDKFHSSIHGVLNCTDCHTTIGSIRIRISPLR